MQRPQIETVPTFYQRYVERVKSYEMLEALRVINKQTLEVIKNIPEAKGDYRYEPGKWSIKELLCHMMDAERIFAYRALRFARNDKTELHGFEENDYAPEANAHGRNLQQLSNEMQRLRITTLDLFTSFTPEMLERSGKANGTEVSVLNIGYIVAGHEAHHLSVLQERYGIA